MNVRELVSGLTKNPDFANLEIGIVTGHKTQNRGQFEGGVAVYFKPLRTVLIGGDGLLFWFDPEVEKKRSVFVADLSKWPGMVVLGPLPDCLKWKI